MIVSMKMDLIFRNREEEFEFYITDISEYEHEIEVFSECIHPTLKRGWKGDMIYHTYKPYELPSANVIEDDVNLVTVKDVLLRSVQCFRMSEGEPIEWKYTFLKD